MSDILEFNRATLTDLPAVINILDDAAEWLHHRGIEQWPSKFSDLNDWRMERISKYVSDGETWIVRSEGQIAATFSLTHADPDYADGWPDGPATGIYIFRMAVKQDFMGKSLGCMLLNWASAYSMALDYRWLRLDCSRTNTDLHRFYEKNGFSRVATQIKTISVDGKPYTRKSGALFQRPAGTLVRDTPGGKVPLRDLRRQTRTA